jgi:hypothetical protein
LFQAPGALYTGSGKGATKIELDDVKAALSELEADDLVVGLAKAPAGANSSTTSGFAARVLDAKIAQVLAVFQEAQRSPKPFLRRTLHPDDQTATMSLSAGEVLHLGVEEAPTTEVEVAYGYVRATGNCESILQG